MLYVLLVLLVAIAVVFGNSMFARLELLEAQVKRLESARQFYVTTTTSTSTPTYSGSATIEASKRRKRSPGKPK